MKEIEREMSMATMVHVAKLAQVSISTVSHVLNGTRRVEPETRQRVLQAIEEIGYRQDTLARAMRRSQTESIGLVVSDAGEPAFAEMVHGVEQAAAEQGLTLLLANSSENADRERKAVRSLLDRRVDGLILARSADSHGSLIPLLEAEKAPVVLLDRVNADLPFDQIGADNRDSMRRLVQHLAAVGHHRFLVVAGDTRVPTLRERYEGFADAVAAANLDPAAQTVIVARDHEHIRSKLRQHTIRGKMPVVIACSTVLAVIALETLAAAQIRTPSDFAFAVFDGFKHPDIFEPKLTTVIQPAFEMGVAAVGLLVDRLVHPESPPRIVRLQQSLQLRDSTETATAVL